MGIKWEDKPGLPQITLRSTIVGLVIGTMVLISNFQFGLQTGWASMMSLPSSLLGFTIFKFLPLSSTFTDVENVYVQSIAVATGTGPLAYGLIGIIPAIEKFLTPEESGLGTVLKFSLSQLIIWSLGLAFFGVFIAIPLRRQVIIKENLPFPSGTATAILISVLHGNTLNQPVQGDHHHHHHHEGEEGEEEGEITESTPLTTADLSLEESYTKNIKSLTITLIISSIYTVTSFFLPILRNIPIFGHTASTYLWTFQPSPAYIGQGIIMGLPTVSYMFFGAVVGWGILSPLSKFMDWAPGDVDDWQNGSQGWIMWISLSIMISDSLVALMVIGVKSIKSLLVKPNLDQELNYILVSDNQEVVDVNEKYLVSNRVTWTGLFISSFICAICLKIIFHDILPLYSIFTAIILAIIFSVLAVRALGETDLNPVSGIGKLSQLLFALIIPPSNTSKILINLVAGGIAEAGAQQSGDLMQDLKTGHIIGASPYAQFVAQVIGTGFSVVVSSFMYLFYNSIYLIPNNVFRIPTAVIWIDCARLVTGEGLPPMVPPFALFFGIVFGTISLLKNLTPRESKYHKYLVYLPSGVAVGIGIYNTPNFTIARFLGGIISYLWLRSGTSEREGEESKGGDRDKKVSMVILSSGLVLGEGLFSVITMIFASLGWGPN